MANKQENKIKQKKLNLFDDDNDNNDDGESRRENEFEFELSNLEKKLNQDERQTSKLIELQSKFAYDSRFTIDKRFLDDDDDNKGGEIPKSEIEEEKSKNLAILEQVLGKKFKPVAPPTVKHGAASASQTRISMQSVFTPRFDPTKVETKIYELTDDSVVDPKRKINIDFDELDRKEQLERKKKAKIMIDEQKSTPSVSKETFYKVTTNLKDSMTNTSDFSFASFFNLDSENHVDAMNENATSIPISASERKSAKMIRNPFKYDSSDDEDNQLDDNALERLKWNDEIEDNTNEQNDEMEENDDDEEEEEKEDNVQIKLFPSPHQVSATFGGFFFRANDPRLLEDLFYSPEKVKQAQEQAKERHLAMMRAISFRKKAAIKNEKTDKKYTKIVAKNWRKNKKTDRYGMRRHSNYGSSFGRRNGILRNGVPRRRDETLRNSYSANGSTPRYHQHKQQQRQPETIVES